MSTFEITGGQPLAGPIWPQGAKNEALQIISAVLLSCDPVVVHNVPDIVDVNLSIGLLRAMGVKVARLAGHAAAGDSPERVPATGTPGPGVRSYCFQADAVDPDYMRHADFLRQGARLRGSVLFAGPMLARFGRACIPQPGGDKIGRRHIDTHLEGFIQLGAQVVYDRAGGFFQIDLPASGVLSAADMLLDEPSVTGTANIVMAAVCARGISTIYNAACEPYVQQLCQMLNRMGAKISGIGSNLLTIEGVDALGGAEHTILPDIIEVGSFIGLAATTGSALTIERTGAIHPHLHTIRYKFRQLGVEVELREDAIHIPAQPHYRIQMPRQGGIPTLYDHPWPGLTPDLLSVFLVVATQAEGSVLIHQKMFESRLFFVDRLIDMGAQIILCDPHRATVIGLARRAPLQGVTMSSPDIRAGIALLIAALSAEGKSTIHNIEQIDRGYEQIETRLCALGAAIERKPAVG